jgi:hypothetical protein
MNGSCFTDVQIVIAESGVPTSVDFVRCEPSQMVVSYSSSNAYVFDMEKSTPIVTLECPSEDGEMLLKTFVS